MCGLGGELRFDGRRRGRRGGPRGCCPCLARRGPDGEGFWARGPGRARPPPAEDHRPVRGRRRSRWSTSELGLTLVFNGCIYNYQELRDELRGRRLPFFSTSDTEVILKAYHRWGAACVEHFLGMFAFAIVEHDTGTVMLARDRLGIKPLYLAETPGRLRFASTLPALLAAGDVDTVDRPGRAAPLHDVPLGGAGAAHDPHRRPQAAAGHGPGDRAATARAPTTVYWEADVHPRPPALTDRARTGSDAVGESLRTAVDRRMVADVPVGVLLSGGLDSSLIVALLAEAGPARADHVQHRLRGGGRRGGRRVRATPTWSPSSSAPTTTRSGSAPTASCRPCTRDRRGDERADGQPRLRRVLPAQRGGVQARQGGAVRAGRRRGARRLRLVPAAGRACPATQAVDAYAREFFDRPHGDLGPAARARSGCSTHDASREFVAAQLRPRPARRPRSTRRCASTRRSCWSTTR